MSDARNFLEWALEYGDRNEPLRLSICDTDETLCFTDGWADDFLKAYAILCLSDDLIRSTIEFALKK